ncbi:hypothetical protein SK128_021664 [Halocaridina rubra]|uniref:Uncharacterized protein n=1 Tax=Halocaridina rubra TaxID=373956 RepID=A0AAN9A348_HALRR
MAAEGGESDPRINRHLDQTETDSLLQSVKDLETGQMVEVREGDRDGGDLEEGKDVVAAGGVVAVMEDAGFGSGGELLVAGGDGDRKDGGDCSEGIGNSSDGGETCGDGGVAGRGKENKQIKKKNLGIKMK